MTPSAPSSAPNTNENDNKVVVIEKLNLTNNSDVILDDVSFEIKKGEVMKII